MVYINIINIGLSVIFLRYRNHTCLWDIEYAYALLWQFTYNYCQYVRSYIFILNIEGYFLREICHVTLQV